MTTDKAASRVRSRASRLRALGVLAAAATVVTLFGATTPASAAVPTTGLLAEYVFTQRSGTSVPNSAGGSALGPATVVNGTDAQWTGESLTFSGGAKTSTTANYVRLPDDILTGKTSATVTTEVKIDASMKTTNHFLWNIGNTSPTQYYFISTKDATRTTISTSGNPGEKTAQSSVALVAGRWYSLTSVIDGAAGQIRYYIDGALAATGSTTVTPANIADQTFNTIGRAPYGDPHFKGEVGAFRIYDRALSVAEIAAASDSDAQLHAASTQAAAQAVADSIVPLTLDDTVVNLPSYDQTVTWASSDPAVQISADGLVAHVTTPATVTTTTLTATVRYRGGFTASSAVPTTLKPAAGADDDYGYLMVHFIENSAGYAEKIYLDISRGDNPEQWDPLNAGKPILASQLGTTGIRDPYLTYNPETGTYYIIATDLRVFGGDRGFAGCFDWCYWRNWGSTKLFVWESTDLVTWSDVRTFDVARNVAGDKVAELGMAWAPEATWVDHYYSDGRGAFVLYWTSRPFQLDDTGHTGTTSGKILWGATTDFTQTTYEYGGVFVDAGTTGVLDTTMIQDGGKTYRITKNESTGIFMESTTSATWWLPGTQWSTIQTKIGAGWAGGKATGVEGPAVFKSHSDHRFYLYVDVIPTGYKPMTTTNLDAGWSMLTSPDFSMAEHTKHGGVISLVKSQYDKVRAADAKALTQTDLGDVTVEKDASPEELAASLPAAADVVLAYQRGNGTLPVDWDTSGVDVSTPGTYEVTGVVRSHGANLNDWVGDGGSTAWNATGKVPRSSTALTVSASVTVAPAAPALDVAATATTRCVAGKVVLAAQVSNPNDVAIAATITTPYGSKVIASLLPGKSASQAFATRAGSIDAGSISVDVSGTVDEDPATASAAVPYSAATCG